MGGGRQGKLLITIHGVLVCTWFCEVNTQQCNRQNSWPLECLSPPPSQDLSDMLALGEKTN